MKRIVLQVMLISLVISIISSELLSNSCVITQLTGKVEVYIFKKQKWFSAKVGLELFGSDKLKTYSDGCVEVTLEDGSTLILRENTELTLAVILSEEKSFDIKAGKVRAKVKPLKSGHKFDIKSQIAVASVRGTEFILVVTDNDTQLLVLSGRVELSNIISGAVKEISEGQISLTNIAGELTEPRNFTPEEIIFINEDSWQKFSPKEGSIEDKEKVVLRQELKDLVYDVKSNIETIRNYVDEIREADISAGRTLRDAFGNIVRVEQCLLRPDPQTIQFLNITKRKDYTYKGFFKYDGPATTRIDSFDAKVKFNLSMPEDITEWPSFVTARGGDTLKPEIMSTKWSNGEDAIEIVGTYNSVKDNWETTTKYKSGTDGEWLVDTKSYDKEESGWYNRGVGIDNSGENTYWMWAISPKIRIYKDTNENKQFDYGIDTQKFVHIGTEMYVINNSGKVLSLYDFIGVETNPFTLLKQIAIQNTMFIRYGYEDRPLAENEDMTTEAKLQKLSEFNNMRSFFSRGNIDIIYTPDIILSATQKLVSQIDKLKFSSN